MSGVDIRSGIGMVVYAGPRLTRKPRLAPAPEWSLVHKKDGWDYDMADLEAWLEAEGTATDRKQKVAAERAGRKATMFPEDGISEPELLNWITPLVSGLTWGGGRRKAFEAARARYTNDYPDPKYLIAFDRAWAKAITRVEADWDAAMHAPPTEHQPKRKPAAREKGRQLTLIDLNDVEEEPIYWVIQDVIPLGTLTILSGAADVGKSTLLATWLTQIMGGTANGDLDGPTTVLTAVGEDDLGRVLKPRMRAAGADLKSGRLQVINITNDGRDTALQIREDLADIRQALIDSSARVLVLDPIISYVEGDPNSLKDVRTALDPIRDLATELNVAVIAVHHHKKGMGNAAEKLSGSHAWRDASRSHILVVKDEDTGVRFATVEKGNYTGERLSFSFETESVVYQNARGADIKTGRVINLRPSETTAHDLLAKAAGLTSTHSGVMQEIVHYVSSSRVAVTTAEVAEAVGEPSNKVKVYLNRAASAGQIVKEARGTYHSLVGVDIRAERIKGQGVRNGKGNK